MKEYIKSTLLCMVCIFGSILAASLAQIIPSLVVSLNTLDVKTKILSLPLFTAFFTYIFIYIIMRRIGYSYNKAYEKKSIKDLLIPIIIFAILFTAIDIVTNYTISNRITGFVYISAWLFTDFNDWYLGMGDSIFEAFKEHSFIFPLSAILQSITYAFFIFLGFVHGYKKREKTRKEITSNKND